MTQRVGTSTFADLKLWQLNQRNSKTITQTYKNTGDTYTNIRPLAYKGAFRFSNPKFPLPLLTPILCPGHPNLKSES